MKAFLAVTLLAASILWPSLSFAGGVELTQADVDRFIAEGNHPPPRTDISNICDDPGEFGWMQKYNVFGTVSLMRRARGFAVCTGDHIRAVMAGGRPVAALRLYGENVPNWYARYQEAQSTE